MAGTVFILLVLTVCLGIPADGAKLLLLPVNINSHIQMMSRLGVAVAEEGHQTVMVAPSNARVPPWARDSKMEIWQFSGEDGEPYANSEASSRLLISAALSESTWGRMKLLFKFIDGLALSWERDCESMFADANLMTKVKEEKFDLVILDISGATCNIALPYSLELPVVAFGIYASTWIFRVPALPSFVPNVMSEQTDHMTFGERLLTFTTEFAGLMMANRTATLHYLPKYAPNRPPLEMLEIAAKSVFWFYLDDIAVSYPKPQMPNTAFLGDVMTSPAKPLPKDLDDFVTSAPDGVVVVSFGSYLDHLPPETISKLCKAFKTIPNKVIWKLKDDDQCQGKGKILTMKWLPQNDLLGHPKVILFVTHAGLNSMIEAVYHATPVVAIPMILDQPQNAQFMTSRGLGDRLSLRDLSTEALVTKMLNVINNETIKENMNKQSFILRNKPETPGRRASFWINHVLKYGGDHLRTGAFELSVPQFYMMDIFLILLLVGITLLVILCICVICTVRCCKRCFCPKPTKEKLKTS